jgi:hypothetical protein
MNGDVCGIKGPLVLKGFTVSTALVESQAAFAVPTIVVGPLELRGFQIAPLAITDLNHKRHSLCLQL